MSCTGFRQVAMSSIPSKQLPEADAKTSHHQSLQYRQQSTSSALSNRTTCESSGHQVATPTAHPTHKRRWLAALGVQTHTAAAAAAADPNAASTCPSLTATTATTTTTSSTGAGGFKPAVPLRSSPLTSSPAKDSPLQHCLSGAASSTIPGHAGFKKPALGALDLLQLSRSRPNLSHQLASCSTGSDRDTISTGRGHGAFSQPPSSQGLQRQQSVTARGSPGCNIPAGPAWQQQEPSAFQAAANGDSNGDSATPMPTAEPQATEPSLAHLPLELQSRLRKKVRLVQPISPLWAAEVMQPTLSVAASPASSGAAAAAAAATSAPACSPETSDQGGGGKSVCAPSVQCPAMEAPTTCAPAFSPHAAALVAPAPMRSSCVAAPAPSRGFRPVSSGVTAAVSASASPACVLPMVLLPAAGRVDGDLLVRQLSIARQASSAVLSPVPPFDAFAAPPPLLPAALVRASSVSNTPAAFAALWSAPPALPSPMPFDHPFASVPTPSPPIGVPWLSPSPEAFVGAAAGGQPLAMPFLFPPACAVAPPLVSPPSASRGVKRGAEGGAIPLPMSRLAVGVAAPLQAASPPAASEDVGGQLSALYQWYQSNKTVYLEQAKQSLMRLEAHRAASATKSGPGDAAVVRAFERAMHIISASSDVEVHSAAAAAAAARPKTTSSNKSGGGGGGAAAAAGAGGSAAAAAAVAQAIINAAQKLTMKVVPAGRLVAGQAQVPAGTLAVRS